jgi:hypothetical protein
MAVFFSAEGGEHTSNGNPVLLSYDVTHSNFGNKWDGISTFEAPFPGYYFFTVTAMREKHGGDFTDDDVSVYLVRSGVNIGRAWCGINVGERVPGTFQVIIPVKQGMRVSTFVGSDGGRARKLAVFQFTGQLLIADPSVSDMRLDEAEDDSVWMEKVK